MITKIQPFQSLITNFGNINSGKNNKTQNNFQNTTKVNLTQAPDSVSFTGNKAEDLDTETRLNIMKTFRYLRNKDFNETGKVYGFDEKTDIRTIEDGRFPQKRIMKTLPDGTTVKARYTPAFNLSLHIDESNGASKDHYALTVTYMAPEKISVESKQVFLFPKMYGGDVFSCEKISKRKEKELINNYLPLIYGGK